MEIENTRQKRYDSTVETLKNKNGDLEEIRSRLGFSQKQMAELLLVDPSAWSRWLRDQNAPPHVYRSLDWYLSALSNIDLSNKKIDSLKKTAPSDSAPNPQSQIQSSASQIETHLEAHFEKWNQEKSELLAQLRKSEQLQAGWKIFLIFNSLVLFYFLFVSN